MAQTRRTLFLKRRMRNRNKIKKMANGRPRLCVHRSSKNISVQLIDDVNGTTIASGAVLRYTSNHSSASYPRFSFAAATSKRSRSSFRFSGERGPRHCSLNCSSRECLITSAVERLACPNTALSCSSCNCMRSA